jgi:hypothetical protein
MQDDSFSGELEAIAALFVYPPTPDLAGQERDRLRHQAPLVNFPPRPTMRRTLVVGTIIMLLLFAALMAIPPVRAAFLRVLQIGAFEINLLEEPPIKPASTPLPGSLTDLGEPISLADAAAQFPFPLISPHTLGAPDWVYIQDFADYPSKIITLVWTGDDGAGGSQIMLTYFGLEGLARKTAGGEQVRDVRIADMAGIWIEGPHLLNLQHLGTSTDLAVDSNVLIWSDGVVTYRLEGKFTLDEAIELAKSMR